MFPWLLAAKKKITELITERIVICLAVTYFLSIVEIFLGVVEILPLFYFCSGRTAKGNNICRPAAKKIDVLFMTDFAWQLAASSQFPLCFIFDRFCLVVGRRVLFS